MIDLGLQVSVAGLRITGKPAPMVLGGPANGDWFEAYVTQMLVPELRPGDVIRAFCV